MIVNNYQKRLDQDKKAFFYKRTEKKQKVSSKVYLKQEKQLPYEMENGNFSRPNEIAEMMYQLYDMRYLADEYAYVLAFDSKLKLLGVMEISHGTVDSSTCRPREIFQAALLMNAVSIVLAHNHPSGEPKPSQDDNLLKERLKKAGQVMGIFLMDSIILGKCNYYSAEENDEL